MKYKINFFIILLIIAITAGVLAYVNYTKKKAVFLKIIERLEADSKIAEVIVSKVEVDENAGEKYTTIKFLEYDFDGKALMPKYFKFQGNIIQFQALVIRFKDNLIRQGDNLKGKSAYIFTKIFLLDGKNTQEYDLTKFNTIPAGYKLDNINSEYEKELWMSFWKYALDSETAFKNGIKNAQIEAPGTKFIPGTLYTIKIEHDGGMRIDTQKIPQILMGEKINKI